MRPGPDRHRDSGRYDPAPAASGHGSFRAPSSSSSWSPWQHQMRMKMPGALDRSCCLAQPLRDSCFKLETGPSNLEEGRKIERGSQNDDDTDDCQGGVFGRNVAHIKTPSVGHAQYPQGPLVMAGV